MERPIDVINYLVNHFSYETYLEIGVLDPNNTFNRVAISLKHGVDINPKTGATFIMPSDEFFSGEHGLPTYDCIYVDGDHRELPALRDIANAIDRISNRGTVVCHDVWPSAPHPAGADLCSSVWCGEVWKAWAYLRMSRPDLWMAVLPITVGCGIIRKGRQRLFVPNELPYLDFKEDPPVNADFYYRYADKLLNMLSVEEFKKVIEAQI